MNIISRLFQRGPTEDRAGYADAVVQQLIAAATGGTADASATAAAEMVCGLLSRAFSRATVGPQAFRGSITPELLSSIARGLGSTGNAVYLVDAADGLLTFYPALDWDVAGRTLDGARWSYRLKLAVPSGELERTVSAARVLHCRVNESPGKPLPVYAIPTPDAATIGQRRGLAADMRAAAQRGAMFFPQTGAKGFGQGALAGTEKDIQAVRLGGVAPDSNISLADSATVRVLQAFGLSAGYFGSGNAVRESRRRHRSHRRHRALRRLHYREANADVWIAGKSSPTPCGAATPGLVSVAPDAG